jgi:hypothetical protein
MQSLIRQATKEDKGSIWRFLDHAYGAGPKGTAQFKYPDRWKWQFLDNPFVDETGDKLPIWLAIKNNEVLGQMCALPALMKIGDQTYNGGWGCDFIVSPKSRGEGIGYKLTEIYNKHFQVGVGIGMAESTRRIWEKFSRVPLNPLYYYLYPIKLDKIILHYLIGNKFRLLHNTMSKLTNVMFSTKRKLNPLLKKEAKSSIQEISVFGTDIDALSENTYREYSAIVKRESVFLNWRFFRNKELKYHVFISKNNNQIKGYIVVRKPHPAELNIGHIVDFYAAKNDMDTINELIFHAIKFFDKSVAAIKCATSMRNIEHRLKKYGFIKFEKMRPLALVSDPAIKEKLISAAGDWFMTLADQDLDQIVFNLANPSKSQ